MQEPILDGARWDQDTKQEVWMLCQYLSTVQIPNIGPCIIFLCGHEKHSPWYASLCLWPEAKQQNKCIFPTLCFLSIFRTRLHRPVAPTLTFSILHFYWAWKCILPVFRNGLSIYLYILKYFTKKLLNR